MEEIQNIAIWNELNEIELERASYLINLDEFVLESHSGFY
jgi:hypothetical protein